MQKDIADTWLLHQNNVSSHMYLHIHEFLAKHNVANASSTSHFLFILEDQNPTHFDRIEV